MLDTEDVKRQILLNQLAIMRAMSVHMAEVYRAELLAQAEATALLLNAPVAP